MSLGLSTINKHKIVHRHQKTSILKETFIQEVKHTQKNYITTT